MIKTLALLSLQTGLALASTSNLPLPVSSLPETTAKEVTIKEVTAKETIANAPATPQPKADEACCAAPENGETVGLDDQLWGKPGDRKELLASIDNSIRYIQTPAAVKSYKEYPVPGVSRERVSRSLTRFRQLVTSSKSPEQLRDAVKKEFAFFQSVGNDNKGTVVFTGYYEPIYQGSRTRTSEYKYAIYKQPADFANWPKPHPTRVQLEGVDGLQGSKGPLAGSELLYMKDRFEVILVQIQGSAKFKLTDGTTTTVGFNGGTDYGYESIGKALLKDKKITQAQATLQGLIKFFRENPKEMDVYLSRYNRFVFMKDTNNSPPMGSLNVPVTPERSIATDKSMMPPGALALVHTSLPYYQNGKLQPRLVSRYVLDQDTGSAITGPGRVDYFMGIGKEAGDRAGVTGGNGRLYYLLLKK
jgi:membrane-bound lytic murein transglycosylase A